MEKRLCACGCGKEIVSKNERVKYRLGHGTRGKTYEEKYGKIRAEKLKKEKRKTYDKRFGKKKAAEIRKKVGKKLKGKINVIKGKTYEEYYGKKKSDEKKNKLSKKLKGKNYEERYGKERAKQIREKASKSLKGLNMWSAQKIIDIHKNDPPMQKSEWELNRKAKKDRPHVETIRNRFGSLENLEKITGKKFLPSNRRGREGNNERFILDEIQKEKEITIKRQKNIGKYFVDGYDPITNTIYEVDEYGHKGQKVQDKIREDKIKEKLPGVKFIRIDEAERLRMINQITVGAFA